MDSDHVGEVFAAVREAEDSLLPGREVDDVELAHPLVAPASGDTTPTRIVLTRITNLSTPKSDT